MRKDVRLGNGTKEQAGKRKHSGTWQTSPDTLMDVCLSLSHPYTHTHTHTHTHARAPEQGCGKQLADGGPVRAGSSLQGEETAP